MKNVVLNIIIVCSFLSFACNTATDKAGKRNDSLASTQNTAAEKDCQNYPQYVSCKINGQPYLAYYDAGHITAITNALNISSQVVFATSADQETINGKTKISELSFSFYTLATKGAGVLASVKDFYVQGHTDFPAGNDLKYTSFKTTSGQTLTLESYNDGILQGRFAFDVADENDPSHILKITDGNFKLLQVKPTNIKPDANGDVNMDSLMKSLNTK